MISSIWTKVLSQWRGEGSVKPRHEGLFGYLRDDIVPLALFSGLLCTLGIIPYTTFLSRQTFECPPWASGCQVYTESVGTIQGAVTLVYTIGLMCIAYACWALAEVSLWPLLCWQTFTCRQIDRFLAVSRGSIPAIPLAFGTIKRWETWLIIMCAVLATLVSLSAGPVVGFIFDQPSLPTTYEGQIVIGGGTPTIFHQQNPPVYVDIASSGFYSDWFSGFSTTEPMPNYRDWIIDRLLLSSRGNFTAKAVMVRKNVTCSPFHVIQMMGPKYPPRHHLRFYTKLANITDQENPNGIGSRSVAVYNTRLLSVWLHDVQFVSSNRTRAYLAFGLPGGIIEGSSTTFLNVTRLEKNSNISAILCEVDIELVDATLTVGDGGKLQSSLPTLSSVQGLISGHKVENKTANNSALYTHKQLALLFAVAPVIIGNSHAGMQPNFTPRKDGEIKGTLIPAGNLGLDGHGSWDTVWRRQQIRDLIEGSISAVSLSMSLKSRVIPVKMGSMVYAHRMEPVRNAVLAVPIAVLLLIWFLLAFLTRLFHNQSGLRVIRTGETAELLGAWQNGLATQDRVVDLGGVQLRYQNDGHGVLGPAGDISTLELKKSDLACDSTLSRYDGKSSDGVDDKIGKV